MNVLVSGVGGDIGLGVARVLREWNANTRLYGIDIHLNHPGEAVLDKCEVAPRASDTSYISWLTDYIFQNNIKIFLPTSEAEIEVLAKEGINWIGDAFVIRTSNFTIEKSLDKHACLSYLASKGIEVPEHGLVGKDVPDRYPIVVKPRSGQGSKGVKVIRTPEELDACESGLVWQRYLVPEDEEYTCPVYSSKMSGTRILLLKRKLIGGLTGSGVVVENEEIEQYVHRIVKCMQLDGAMNIQLRLTDAGPLLFEINPRISSTVVFRDKLGFTDVRWWLADRLGLKKTHYSAPKAGTRFYRGAHEYILSN